MKYPLFRGIDEEAVRIFLANGARAFYNPREVIFSQGDDGNMLHLLEDGHVAIKMDLATGDSLCLRILGPGSAFGEESVLCRSPARYTTARAVDSVTVVKISADRFHEFRRSHAAIDENVFSSLCNTIELLHDQLVDLSSQSVEVRLLRRLVDVAGIYRSQRVPAGTTIPLTQQDLAELVGTSRPTVNMILQRAQRSGLVRLSRGRILIPSIENLQRRAGTTK